VGLKWHAYGRQKVKFKNQVQNQVEKNQVQKSISRTRDFKNQGADQQITDPSNHPESIW
jgi:hypothetical protein